MASIEKHAKFLEKRKPLLRKLHTWPKLSRRIILQSSNYYVPSLKLRAFKVENVLGQAFALQIRSAKVRFFLQTCHTATYTGLQEHSPQVKQTW